MTADTSPNATTASPTAPPSKTTAATQEESPAPLNVTAMRACQISVSVFKETKETRWGIALDPGSATILQDDDTCKINGVVVTALTHDGLLGPLVGDEVLRVGDLLWTINGMRYRNAKRATQRLLGLQGDITLVFATNCEDLNGDSSTPAVAATAITNDDDQDDESKAQSDDVDQQKEQQPQPKMINVHPNVYEAVVVKRNIDARLGIGFHSVLAAPAAADAQEQQPQQEEGEEGAEGTETNEEGAADGKDKPASTNEEGTNKDEGAAVKNEAEEEQPTTEPAESSTTSANAKDDDDTQQPQGTPLLAVRVIDPKAVLSSSLLQHNDLILCVNGAAASHWTATQAIDHLRRCQSRMVRLTVLRTQPTILSRSQQMLRQAKRAGIALGGGTMVGVGLIFIPTLPPPFGEVLIVGGISVLGTEFEGPKKVMRNARDSLVRVVDDDAAVEAESSKEPPKRGMGDRLKRFGRNVVLPFLDQVVGDSDRSAAAAADGGKKDGEEAGDEKKEGDVVDDVADDGSGSKKEGHVAEADEGEEKKEDDDVAVLVKPAPVQPVAANADTPE